MKLEILDTSSTEEGSVEVGAVGEALDRVVLIDGVHAGQGAESSLVWGNAGWTKPNDVVGQVVVVTSVCVALHNGRGDLDWLAVSIDPYGTNELREELPGFGPLSLERSPWSGLEGTASFFDNEL